MTNFKADLAINGGRKTVPELPGRFHFGREEKAAVDALFDASIESGNVFGYNGPEEEAFCREFAAFYGGGYADGVNSGTNAVFVALRALNLPAFSEVIVGCVTDPGGMMPVVLNGCVPVPADTEPGSFNTGAAQIARRITERTSAIVIAHIGGEPANMPEIMKLADQYHLPVVEDCAQTHYGKIGGRPVGTFGKVAAFSLMFGKHICAGGQGGAVFTRDEKLYWRIRQSADRGKPFGLPPGSTNILPSLNCNMDELHATIARVQLKKLKSIVERRREVVRKLRELVMNELHGISIPQNDLPDHIDCCYWWWRLRFKPEAVTCSREEYCAALQAEGLIIGANYCAAMPMNQDWFRNRARFFPWNYPPCQTDGAELYPCPNAEAVMATDFILFFYESFDDTVIGQIAEAFRKVDRAFTR